MFKAVNENYQEGKITKQDLLSWITIKFQNKYFEKSIAEIRTVHKDPIRILELQIVALKAKKNMQKEGSI